METEIVKTALKLVEVIDNATNDKRFKFWMKEQDLWWVFCFLLVWNLKIISAFKGTAEIDSRAKMAADFRLEFTGKVWRTIMLIFWRQKLPHRELKKKKKRIPFPLSVCLTLNIWHLNFNPLCWHGVWQTPRAKIAFF